MLVDDDVESMQVIKEALSSATVEIVTASNGYDALKLLDTRQWDLAIIEVMMPGMSGYELTRRIRERFSLTELPVLLLTARSDISDVQAGFQAGANDYVTKPSDINELRIRAQCLAALRTTAQENARLEAAALQAQIQPHFLLNTLSSIASLSATDQERMRRLLGVFGDYLRGCFDPANLQSVVPLTKELDLVRSFLYILRERFGDRLKVQWDIDRQIDPDQVFIPPLSIQPLVENAVTHGVLARIEGGTVKIAIARVNDYVRITVQDDGIGMDPDTLDRLAAATSRYDAGGRIGLWNTNRRLKQLFGTGLSIESAPDQGTTVSFQVPA